MRPTNELLIIGLILASTISFLGYGFYFAFPSAQCPAYSYTADQVIRIPGAPSLDPSVLLSRSSLTGGPGTHSGDDFGSIAGIPKLIHQSWKEEELPHKFLEWSNSFRTKHPDWKWVLWTDNDNAALVASHFPSLNESYWALRNNIQRADFVFRGDIRLEHIVHCVYADLDMECLRPLDTLFTKPLDHVSSTFPLISHPDTQYAFVGSMDVDPDDWTKLHSIPNAFMASTPHHPLWLIPLSNVLTRFEADDNGNLPLGEDAASWWKNVVEDLPGMREGTESITGPVALLNAVQTYRAWLGHDVHSSPGEVETTPEEPFFPSLQHHAALAPSHHEVVVFDPAVIYPFSWATEGKNKKGDVYKHCRAAPGLDFKPLQCQELVQAYERGARMITYWSHTWHQSGDGADLDVVGS